MIDQLRDRLMKELINDNFINMIQENMIEIL